MVGIFGRRWIVLTILMTAATALMVRLGFWQLDRLHQRKEFNARIIFQREQPPLVLDSQSVSQDLIGMEYRRVVARGVYKHELSLILINQVYQGQYGAHLITPLQLDGSNMYVLVDRGWIPAVHEFSNDWEEYAEFGLVEVKGVIRNSYDKPGFGALPIPTFLPSQKFQIRWLFVNIAQIERQINLPLLPVYIQQSPDLMQEKPPYRTELEMDLTEGPHLGYALQWFTFAAIFIIGYPVFVQHEGKKER